MADSAAAILETGTEAVRIAEFLGLSDVSDKLALAETVGRGLPVLAAKHVHDTIGSATFHRIVPEATYRRVRRQKRPLTRETSEKLYEFGRVFQLTMKIYRGERDQAMRFLETPHRLLGGRAPIVLATSSSAGADAVIDLLRSADAGFAV